MHDTIFAPATATTGKAGVAIIRVSGPKAGVAVLALCKLRTLPAPRKVYNLRLYRTPSLQSWAVPHETKMQHPLPVEQNDTTNSIIDDAIVIWFPAPKSFTGEDIAEFHVHGSRAVTNSLLHELSKIEGLRPAEPGEFSRRAFENGKMDLAQTEGLADLIDAETEAQHKQAMRQMSGEMSALYHNFREQLLTILANIEAYIDFPDEDIPADTAKKMIGSAQGLLMQLQSHLDDDRGELIRDGLYATIVGAPNAGKSSLLNRLARRDVAIVSNIAGTTRDVIETRIDLAGVPVTIADTAGLRETAEEIESEGIRRALKHAENADIKICVFDATQPPDEATLKMIDKNSIVVVNKVDQVTGSLSLESRVQSLVNKIILPPACGGKLDGGCQTTKHSHQKSGKQVSSDSLHLLQAGEDKIIYASAKTGKGIDKLLAVLAEIISNKTTSGSSPMITRERHRIAVQSAAGYIKGFIEGIKSSRDIELTAEDLRLASRELGRVTGIIGVEDILDKIFSSFCIGK